MEHLPSNPDATDELAGDALADALPERRREARLSIVTRATLFPPIRFDITSGAPAQAAVGTRRVCLADISYMGVRFRTAGPHEPGERWRMKVEAGPMKLDSSVEVVRCVFDQASGYEAGARFLTTELPLRGAAPIASVPRNPSRHLVPRKAG